jgi:hypothetical protein
MRSPLETATVSAPCPSTTHSGVTRTPVRALLLVVSAYLYMVVGLQRVAAASPWITGDWLINYADGFVRRGLFGEICRQLYLRGGVDPISSLIVFKALLYAGLCASLLVLAAKRTIGVIEIAILLSPAALPFELYDPLGSGRKEIALLAVFALYVVLHHFLTTSEGSIQRQWQFWYLLVAFPALTLLHEGLFFFIPFFLAYGWMTRDSVGYRDTLVFGIPYIVAAAALFLSWEFSGGNGTSAAMCSSLRAMSLDSELCGGAVAALDRYDVYIGGADVARYLGLAIVTFVPLFWYATRALDPSRHGRFVASTAVAFAATMPLYVLSEDWGRWMHISTVLMFVTVLACKDRPVRLPSRQPVLAIACIAVICVYVSSWRMPHWIHSPLPIVKVVTSLQRVTKRGSVVALPGRPWPSFEALNFADVSCASVL